MAKKATVGEILKAGMATDVIPRSASTDRRGRATWTRGELSLVAMLVRRPDERLGWRAFAGDAKLGPVLSKFGSLSVAIDPAVDDSIGWPETSGHQEPLETFLSNGIGAAQCFVDDRADLARLLASEFDVRRGGLTTWLPHASFPARLVQALIVARDLELTDLESEIREKLNPGALVLLPDGQEVDIAVSARRWAGQYSKALGVEIPVP